MILAQRRWDEKYDSDSVVVSKVAQLRKPLLRGPQQHGWIVDVWTVIGNSAGQRSEIRHQQDQQVLANKPFVGQPIAPVSKQVRTGSRFVEFHFPDNQYEIARAHLSMRE